VRLSSTPRITRTASRPSPAFYILDDVVYVYANTTGKDGGELVGTVTADKETLLFTMRVERDLRGQFVSASEFAYLIYLWEDPAPGTSEVGVPRLVQ
jgi:hypothetical protein